MKPIKTQIEEMIETEYKEHAIQGEKMKTKKQLLKQIEQLQIQLKELKNSDYTKIIHNNKEFRIYKWENKPFKEFPIPKGYDFAEYFDVVELINLDKIMFTKPWKEIYVCRNQFKRNKEYCLSRFYLNVGLNLDSNNSDLDNSNGNGRVIISKVIKEKEE